MAPKIKWNLAGFRALRTDPKVAADLRARAERVAAAAGDGFEVGDPQPPRNRAHEIVFTQSAAAKRDNNRLLTALQAGR